MSDEKQAAASSEVPLLSAEEVGTLRKGWIEDLITIDLTPYVQQRILLTLETLQAANARLVRENVRLQQDLKKWREELARTEREYQRMAEERVVMEDDA